MNKTGVLFAYNVVKAENGNIFIKISVYYTLFYYL